MRTVYRGTAIAVLASSLALGWDQKGLRQLPRDPGPRAGQTNAGRMLPNLVGPERQAFAKGLEVFERVNSVQGDTLIPNTEAGLGPTFNMDRCAGCHAYPATGGSSPLKNPEVEVANKEGARDQVPSFVRPDGPALQVRFRWSMAQVRDGTVHPLFTITGRKDAGQCDLDQPDFQRAFSANNLSFRIPPPLFGDGLIEAIPDQEILANEAAQVLTKHRQGITGHPNRLPDGSLGRFGWKAHARSLEVFTAEAYLVEEGVTSEIFPDERNTVPASCLLNAQPEDRKNVASRRGLDSLSNVSLLAQYIRFLAPPASGPLLADAVSGKELFEEIGCSLCHTPELRTGRSSWPALADQGVPLYSDLLLHHMGSGLADEIVEGAAGPDEFRTAPLWGLGQRLFLLHDGQTQDLVRAILAHADTSAATHERSRLYPPSEANQVIKNYLHLSPEGQQKLLTFLRSL